MNSTMGTGNMEMSSASMGTTKKEGKGMMFGMIACAILAIGGIGFGVYEMTKKSSSSESIETIKNNGNIDLESICAVTDIKEINEKEITADSEVEITNAYIKNDLNRKISILTSISNIEEDDKTVINNSIAYNENENFYSRGFESTSEKAMAVLIASDRYFKSYDVRDLEWAQDPVSTYLRNTYASTIDSIKQQGVYKSISYSLANKIYSGLFNEDMPKESFGGFCPYHFTYIREADAFVNTMGYDGIGGCGGTGFMGVFVRKDSFKAKKDEAYVYAHIASAGLLDCGADGGYKLMNDFYTYDALDCSNMISDNVPINMGGIATGEIDSSLLDQAASYRFVFKKNTDGTYFFDKLEKL